MTLNIIYWPRESSPDDVSAVNWPRNSTLPIWLSSSCCSPRTQLHLARYLYQIEIGLVFFQSYFSHSVSFVVGAEHRQLRTRSLAEIHVECCSELLRVVEVDCWLINNYSSNKYSSNKYSSNKAMEVSKVWHCLIEKLWSWVLKY